MDEANREAWEHLHRECEARNALLVAVSKKKPAAAITALYTLGQRDFGENYVQEFLEKRASLPEDIRWHFIGHLQKNKVKQIVGATYLIHGVDSLPLLEEIAKQSEKRGVVAQILLQMHIAQEDTKYGMDEAECREALRMYRSEESLRGHVQVRGLMGMASFTEDEAQVRRELRRLRHCFDAFRQEFFSDDTAFDTLSMGMSGDYAMALEEGSTLIRVGSLLFGARQ